MPSPPRATKHHPSSVDLELVKRLIQTTKVGGWWVGMCGWGGVG
jgi:phosphoenolpyruvate-protein kinase (PTS system EI component)